MKRLVICRWVAVILGGGMLLQLPGCLGGLIPVGFALFESATLAQFFRGLIGN